MKKYIFIVVLATTIVACNNNKQNAESENITEKESVGEQSEIANIYNKEWKLIELDTEVIALDPAFKTEPYIVFKEDGRVSGNLGCNNFGGNIEILQDNEVKFTNIASTQMACPNLKVEQRFSEVLNSARILHSGGGALTLSDEKDMIIARFEEVKK